MAKRKKPVDPINEVVTYWTSQLRAGREYRKKFSTHDKWPHYRDMYRGNWSDAFVPVNRVFSYGRSLVPRVYFRSPYVTVTARRPEYVQHARVLEAVDNWLIQETMLKQTLKKSALDTYLNGTGPVKLGYDSEYGYVPDMAVDKDSATATQFARKERRVIEYKTQIKSGMPWALPVLADDVVVPYGYRAASDLPWIGHRVLRPLEDVQQDQKYSNVGSLVGSRMSLIGDKETRKAPFGVNEIAFAELWEIRDKREGRIITLCENQILLNEPDELQIEGLPWEFTIFNEDPEHFWGIADVAIMEPQQKELNDVRTQQSKHRKIALLKFLIQKGIMSEAALEAFTSGEVGPIVEVEIEQLAAAVMMLQPHVPPEFSGIVQEIRSDMRESMGFSENELGAFSPYHGKTATETMQVANSNDDRTNERKDIMADVMTNIIRKWNQMIFKLWDDEKVIEVAGPNAMEGWVRYTGQQLQGEYNVKIDPESGFPVSRALRTQLSTEITKQYAGDTLLDQVRLRKQHLETYEWAFPGLSSLLIGMEANPLLAQEAANLRQPGPMGGGGGNPMMPGQGNRGGGREAGGNPTNAIPFDKFKTGGAGGK